MEEQSMNAESLKQADHSRRHPQKRRRSPVFLCIYLIILLALLVTSACVLDYVQTALEEYEASQPENILVAQIEKLRELEELGKFEDMMSMESFRSESGITEEEIAQFKKDFLTGTITFQEDHKVVDPAKKTFDILCNGTKVATVTLNHEGQETRLLIFTLDRWSLGNMEVTGY